MLTGTFSISPTYANRTDLSTALKVRFSVEERVEHSARARAFYRWYSRNDAWVDVPIFVTGLLPLVLAAACDSFVKWLLGDTDWVETLGLLVFITCLIALSYTVPFVGLGLTAGMTLFVLWLWFVHIMDDYGRELKREQYKKTSRNWI